MGTARARMWAAALAAGLSGLSLACEAGESVEQAGESVEQAGESVEAASATEVGALSEAPRAVSPAVTAVNDLDGALERPNGPISKAALAGVAARTPFTDGLPAAPSADATLPPTPEVDCDAIPEGPFPLTKLTGPMASEDLAFDRHGHLIGSNDKAIFKSKYGQTPQLFVPSFNFRAGLRALPNGHLIVCDNQKGELTRVDEQGLKYPLVTGLSYPNGLEIDLQGWVYFTEHDADVVWRVHPFTGDKTMITNEISNPNGLSFSPDYKTLYIGGFNGNPTIYAMSISPDGVPGKLVPFASVGTGWHDGMAVDACGNVYVADYSESKIYRITPDGQSSKVIIDGKSLGAYLPNMQWGTGVGGWDQLSLYLPNGWAKEVFEVKIGVPSKPTAYHP